MGTGVVVLVACHDDQRPPTPAPSVRLAEVTGKAAANLTPDGTFIVRTGAVSEPPAEIPASQAQSLARVYAHSYATSLQGLLEKEHRRSIDLATLEPCGRAFYSASPFEPLPATPPSATRIALGPSWLVPLCSRQGTPSVTVAVSAYATYIEIVKGFLEWHVPGGGEFWAVGIPFGQAIPTSPEAAVHTIASATGRRVTDVPDLITRDKFVVPYDAVWRIVLDGAAVVRGREAQNESQETTLFVGAVSDQDGTSPVYRGRDDGGTSEWVPYDNNGGPNRPLASISIRRRPGMPRRVERVDVGTGGR
ncbi:MAG: hypothetical protein NVS4B3_24970 [Gemmatimonadaceae bacterium]